MYRPELLSRVKLSVGGVVALFLIAGASVLCATAPDAAKNKLSGKPATPEETAFVQFQKTVAPILEERCYECHGDGKQKGGLDLDELSTKEKLLHSPQVWLKVLRNTRSHIMPPPGEEVPTPDEQRALEQWIKTGAFGLDPAQPDPGRVTTRRLNRTEYRNTLRDLLGIDFNADAALPPDDVGYGFDDIGDVLSISPMRMEKFIEAAIAAVNQGVPLDTVVMTTRFTNGNEFLTEDGSQTAEKMSYYRPQKSSHRYLVKAEGDYRILLHTKIDGEATPVDPQHAHVVWFNDGKELLNKEYKWADADYLDDAFTVHWGAGEHELSVSIEPVFPELQPLRTKMEYRLLWVDVDGPLDKKQWEHHPNYARFFTRDRPPEQPSERRAYAREVLAKFAARAYRRPVTRETVNQLVDIAERTYSLPGTTFEKGISQAIVAVLASPHFLFHLEEAEPVRRGQAVARIDEYSLASRLSYALWSSMPDDELTQLAARGQLRENFPAQVRRMLADPKAHAFAENFSGQWLQARGVLDIPINSTVVMEAERPPAPATAPAASSSPAKPGDPAATVGDVVAAVTRGGGAGPNGGANRFAPPGGGAPPNGLPPGFAPGNRNFPPRPGGFGRGRFGRPSVPPGTVLTPEIRAAMKQETDAYFDYIVREDRSVLELLDSNYIFVNEQLAPVYGIPNITGKEMRRVELPADSVRGGVLTMGSVLTVTSNPTRTSPVKRGKWILENILGAPPAPPPPNVPALEDSQVKSELKAPTQRELLARHRADPKCASCHERMDPLGLAMENFNAFGRLRTQEFGQPIVAEGELANGEKFSGVRDVKRALVENHRIEFYRTITEKLMTYVLGRGLEYYDVPTVDAIVARLDQDHGRFSTLLFGVLESAPFQQRRITPNSIASDTRPVALAAQPMSTP
jgi:hypothetical protein